MKRALIGGFIISGKPDCQAQKADLLIEDGKIAAIGNIDRTGAEIMDCTGKYIMPGLINMHAHLFRSEERRVGKECRSRWSPYH